MARLFTQLHHILACHHDLVIHGCYLSLCNALRRGYSKAFVGFLPSLCLSHLDLVHTMETKPLHASSSNLADMLNMMRG